VSHSHAALVDALFSEVEFRGHCTHVLASCRLTEKGWNVLAAHDTTLSARAWKVPSGHAAHATPDCVHPHPRWHTQVLMSFRVWLSCAVFAGHARHVEGLVAAAAVEKVLFAHSVHATLPLPGLKRQAWHCTQRPAWMPPAPGS